MKRISLTVALAMAVLLLSGAALAQNAGYNLFQTGSGTQDDLNNFGLGIVTLQGDPIQTSLGNSDTIIQRLDPVPPGGGTIGLAVNALFLKSANPTSFHGQAVDVYVTVNNSNGVIPTTVLPQPDQLQASTGTATVRSDGTFDLNLTINADVILVKAGASVTNPANWVGHQPGLAVSVSSTNSKWQTSPPPGYPNVSKYPAGGIYIPQIPSPPHPVVAASTLIATATN